MELRITNWQNSTPPTEAELRQIHRNEGLSPFAWSNAPGDSYASHTHSYDKVIFVLRGSITWILPDLDRRIDTRAGDRVDLPKGTRHAAEVGPHGVTCLEAHAG